MRTQEIELRKSEIREKLANIEFAEATDDQKTEARALTKEYADLEVEFRSAMILETEERAALEDEAKKAESKEDEFDVECRAFSIRAATMGSLGEGLTGRPEKEVSEELEQRDGAPREGGIRVPWAALCPDEVEVRERCGRNNDRCGRPVYSPANDPCGKIVCTDGGGDVWGAAIDRLRGTALAGNHGGQGTCLGIGGRGHGCGGNHGHGACANAAHVVVSIPYFEAIASYGPPARILVTC